VQRARLAARSAFAARGVGFFRSFLSLRLAADFLSFAGRVFLSSARTTDGSASTSAITSGVGSAPKAASAARTSSDLRGRRPAAASAARSVSSR